MNKSHKHQQSLGEVLVQLAENNLYAKIVSDPHKARLVVKGKQIRVRGRHDGAGWYLPDPREFLDEGSDVVIFVDFTDMYPLLFIVPMDDLYKELRAEPMTLKRDAIVQWLNRWDVMK